MDLASIKDQVSNLSLYDLKAGVRKVQNGKNYKEQGNSAITCPRANGGLSSCNELHRDGGEGTRASCESWYWTDRCHKVREATNNEPWGASSTLMQEIANATHS